MKFVINGENSGSFGRLAAESAVEILMERAFSLRKAIEDILSVGGGKS